MKYNRSEFIKAGVREGFGMVLRSMRPEGVTDMT